MTNFFAEATQHMKRFGKHLSTMKSFIEAYAAGDGADVLKAADCAEASPEVVKLLKQKLARMKRSTKDVATE